MSPQFQAVEIFSSKNGTGSGVFWVEKLSFRTVLVIINLLSSADPFYYKVDFTIPQNLALDRKKTFLWYTIQFYEYNTIKHSHMRHD